MKFMNIIFRSASLIVSVPFYVLLFAGHSAVAQERGAAGSRKSPCQLNLLGFTRAETAFSTALVTQLVGSGQTIPNIVLPSAPVVSAILMAGLGAAEDTPTKMEILQALGIDPTVTFETLAETAASLNRQVQLNGDGINTPISRLVNALFVREGAPSVTDHYREAMSASFGAQISSMDPTALYLVNEFVRKATEGRIENLLTEVSPLMQMIIAGASYFKGGWMHPMKEASTRPGQFFPNGSGNGGFLVDMMNSVAPHGYLDGDSFEAVELAIRGPYLEPKPGEEMRPRYSALLLLPKASRTLLEILPSLRVPGALDSIGSQMDRANFTELTVPRFGVFWNGDLIPYLQNMGVQTPFGGASDFSNMFEVAGREIYISQVQTSGFLEFNEKGIAGGGAAVVELSLRGGGPIPTHQVVFDRPFLLVLRDNELGYTFLEVVVSQPNRSRIQICLPRTGDAGC